MFPYFSELTYNHRHCLLRLHNKSHKIHQLCKHTQIVTLRFTACKHASMQASKCAGERTTLALKPMGRVTQGPKQGQSVAP